MSRPTPLPPSEWQFPPPATADEFGIVGVGADLEPSTIVGAYRQGLFPMPINGDDEDELIGWWSPRERGVLEFDDLRITRSLRQSCRRYDVTINADFDAVIGACATIERDGGWISPRIRAAYRRMHRMGWTHSVETWQEGTLVGGLYGIQVGGLFAGESMFHTATDASKVALVALVSALEDVGATFIDVQWHTDHLATLGVRKIAQRSYLRRLEEALASSARSLASSPEPGWVAKSPRYLDRTRQRPMVQKPSATPRER
ncbi:MAG: leucyl/phenylalanyl-tRNA--protein transferase [Actinomycetota bacterium]